MKILICCIIGIILIIIVSYICGSSSFVGYYVAPDMIFYNGAYYKEVIDEAKTEEIYAYGDGYWTYTETYVLSEKPKFPFFEYWIPDLFFYHVVVPGDKDNIYIILDPIEEQSYFERQ